MLHNTIIARESNWGQENRLECPAFATANAGGERTPRKSVRDFCPAVEGRLPAALLRLARHLRTRGLFERLRAVTGKAAYAGKPLRLPSNGCVVNENGAAAKGAAVVYNNEKMQWCRRALAPQCRPTRGRTNDQAHRAAVG